jgi:hypothetical protein
VKVAGKDAHRTRIHLFLTIVGLVGIPGLFLPFIGNASPLRVALDSQLWQAGLPAFVVVPASLASIRWMISGSLSMAERVIAYIAAALMAVVSVSVWVRTNQFSQDDLLFMFTPQMLVLGIGIAALIRNAKMPLASRYNPVMSLQVVYVAHATPWLITTYGTEFFKGWQIGAYLILIAALAYVVQMVLVSVQDD